MFFDRSQRFELDATVFVNRLLGLWIVCSNIEAQLVAEFREVVLQILVANDEIDDRRVAGLVDRVAHVVALLENSLQFLVEVQVVFTTELTQADLHTRVRDFACPDEYESVLVA